MIDSTMKKYIKPAAELVRVELAGAVVVQSFYVESGSDDDGDFQDPGHSLSKGTGLWDDEPGW